MSNAKAAYTDALQISRGRLKHSWMSDGNIVQHKKSLMIPMATSCANLDFPAIIILFKNGIEGERGEIGVAFVSHANQMIGISKDKVRHASRKDDDKDQLDRNHRQEYQQIQQYRGKEIAT
ncbi:hypothetical protein V1477_018398 [Vespula maculifrons]|uniref:Uncharacterized protein n=1 Tax=Vespula maculifrons TaxID=7453 RepID=A0ABD2B1A3_VESMC